MHNRLFHKIKDAIRRSYVYGRILKLLRRIPLVLTVAALLWGYYVYVRYFCVDENDLEIMADMWLAQSVCFLTWHGLLTMFVTTFVQVYFTRHRSIPKLFRVPRRFTNELCDLAEKSVMQRRIRDRVYANAMPVAIRDAGGGVRFCVKCSTVKPDRAHHCSVCDRCVLRMDHHCSWMSVCVGFDNQKTYCLLLGHAVVICVFVAVTTAPHVYRTAKMAALVVPANRQMTTLCCVTAMWCVPLVFLLRDNFAAVRRNRTAIEAVQDVQLVNGPLDGAFDLGAWRNVCEIFGEDWRQWLLPTWTTLGNGYQFVHRKRIYRSPASTRSVKA